MLNYIGPNIGPGPMSAALPPVSPGTMPSGVPGASTLPAAPPAVHIHNHGAPPPAGALAAILSKAQAAPQEGPPPPPDYGTTTQEDGSILLHIRNPDGTMGPVVKVIPPIKRPDSK